MAGGGDDREFERQLGEVGAQTGALPVAAQAPLKSSKVAIRADESARARNWLTLIAAGTYAGFVAISIVYLVYRGAWCGENVWPEILDLGKTMVLPVITLVAGHFYGSRSK